MCLNLRRTPRNETDFRELQQFLMCLIGPLSSPHLSLNGSKRARLDNHDSKAIIIRASPIHSHSCYTCIPGYMSCLHGTMVIYFDSLRL
jgi:hypothetical protein